MNSKLFALLSFVVTYLLLLVFHHEVMLSPNSFLLGDMVDGLKNYYTPLYHVYFDESLSRFEGMNYPFGEQIVFADAQPLLSNSLKIFSNIWDVKPYTVGIINFLMFSSMPLAALFLFLAFKEVKVKNEVAFLGSILIALLSPQLYRLGGHFALSYAFVIPLFLWLYLKGKSRWSVLSSLTIGLIIWLLAGLHMYYFALGAFFFLLVRLFEFVFGQFMHSKKFGIQISLEVLLPYLLLQVWFYFTDQVTDRPNNPYGFLEYCSHWQSVFLPIGKSYLSIFQSVFSVKPHSWEGLAYIGFLTSLFFVFGWLYLITKKLKVTGISFYGPMALSGIILLLFSFGAPFIWNLEWLVEYSGPLKQFRGVGRFAWVFFFVISFLFFVWINHFFLLKKTPVKVAYTIAIVLVFGFEVYAHQMIRPYQKNSAELIQKSIFEKENPISFSAIIPIPFFHTGSENIWVNEDGSEILKYSFVESLKSGKPIVGVQMSRTSLSQTIETLKLVYNGQEEPEFIDPKRDYLLVKENNYKAFGLLERLLKNAAFIAENESYSTWTISGEYILAAAENFNEKTPGKIIFSDNYNDQTTNLTYEGKGALTGNMKKFTKLYEYKADTANANLIIDFMYYMNKDVNPTVSIIEEHVDKNGKVVIYKSNPIFVYLESAGNWSKISYPVELEKGHKLLLHLQKYTAKKREIWVDNLNVFLQPKPEKYTSPQ